MFFETPTQSQLVWLHSTFHYKCQVTAETLKHCLLFVLWFIRPLKQLSLV